jgi:hypothetical protein
MNSVCAMMVTIFLIFFADGWAKTYTTNFDSDENPISEGGVWSHAGSDWHYVRTSGGIAYGTQTAGGYSDSYALLSGFQANQTAFGVVHVVRPIPDDGHTHELEMLLRWTDAAHSAKGYECLFDQGGGVQMVRWNGALGDFTVLSPTEYGSGGPIQDGDTLKASIIGNVITMYVNSVKRAQLTDNSLAAGQPGMGFCCGTLATDPYYALTSYTATDGQGTSEERSGAGTPAVSVLSPNSPNPFQSITFLKWTNPAEGHVTLRVYDALGRVIATLVDREMVAGKFTAGFNGSALKSGIYTAHLTLGNSAHSQKMLLLK